MCWSWSVRVCALLVITLSLTLPAPAEIARVVPVATTFCNTDMPAECADVDAIVFVHGIFGGDDSFKNPITQFDWPRNFPRQINSRRIDVYKLIYSTQLLAWAHGSNPSFEDLAKSVLEAMRPLRAAGYGSIGFIAHSLGGNVISTYIHTVKTAIGHPQRSQNAFVITLATPVLGAQIADLASLMKSSLGMSDPLLDSLKHGNLYLTMLQKFREEEVGKGERYGCRPVHLHAAIEEKYLGPVLVVGSESAALSISNFVNSPIVGFDLNHEMIAKPDDASSGVYRWVLDRVQQEYQRVSDWDLSHDRGRHHLCSLMDYLPE